MMDVKQVIELLMACMNSLRSQGGLAFGALEGTTGNVNVLQRDMNKALMAWNERKDAAGLQAMAGTLQVMGNLTDEEYEQIMDALGVNRG